MADTPETPDSEQHTGVGVFLIPAADDPIVAASSEQAHMTTIWMGTVDDLNLDTPEYPMIDIDTLMQEVRQYAAELTPITVPVATPGRGLLGGDDADVVFLEPTDALIALRDGLLAEEQVGSAYRRVEQYPQWTPHVTMGYPDTPALGEYDGDAVTFDRVGLWIGPDQYEYPMGEAMSKGLAAGGIVESSGPMKTVVGDAAPDQIVPLSTLQAIGLTPERLEKLALIAAAPPVDTSAPESDMTDPEVDEMPDDELEEGEELVTTIPVHGVATLEGKPTGDGRGFRPGALSFGRLPAPLGYEFEYGHGSDNSRVATVGRVDEFFTVPSPTEGDGVFEVRWRGVIDLTTEYGARAVQGIVDGSADGVSVVIDSVTRDVSEERAAVRSQIEAEMSGKNPTEDMDIEQLLDMFVGDGTTETRWFSAARIRRFDMVPTGAFQEGYIALGHEFADELTDEQLAIAASALEDCGCPDVEEGRAVIAAAHWYEAFRTVPADKRKKLADEGKAMPDGSFPIANVDDLRNAIRAIGRAKDPAAAKAHIRKRAEELGQEDLIPKEWYSLVESVKQAIAYQDVFMGNSPESIERGFLERATTVDPDLIRSLVAERFAPGTHDGPGWITHPNATARIRRYWTRGKGAAKIAWGTPGDFDRCRAQLVKYVQNPDWLAGLCSNMHKEVLGVWPGQEGGGRKGNRGHHALLASAEPAPLFALVAAVEPIEASFFRRRELDNPRVGLVVDGDAVYGYIAQWNVCHIGNPQGQNRCTMAPHSPSNYGLFRTGTVMTTEGPVAVGQITMDTGHADVYSAPQAAAAHYDNTGAAVADIACGEDAFGIWFAGKIRPTATDDQRFALAASGRLSGDWRLYGPSHELIAALVVNVPGFPIPEVAIAASADIGLTTILAAGIIRPEEVNEPYVRPLAEDTVEDEQEITAMLAAARVAFSARILADARTALNHRIQADAQLAANSKGI